MIVGVAYHSPLDVSTFFPVGAKISLDSNEDACFFITDKYVENYKALVQIVFSSFEVLSEFEFPILDHGSWGSVVNISNNAFESLLKISKIKGKDCSNEQQRSEPDTSEWIWV